MKNKYILWINIISIILVFFISFYLSFKDYSLIKEIGKDYSIAKIRYDRHKRYGYSDTYDFYFLEKKDGKKIYIYRNQPEHLATNITHNNRIDCVVYSNKNPNNFVSDTQFNLGKFSFGYFFFCVFFFSMIIFSLQYTLKKIIFVGFPKVKEFIKEHLLES